jgi:hypothetical protein
LLKTSVLHYNGQVDLTLEPLGDLSMDKNTFIQTDFGDNLIIIKHVFKGSLDLNHYTKTMTVLNRQLRKSLNYAGIESKYSSLEITKVKNGSLIAFLHTAQQLTPYATVLLNQRNLELMRVWLSKLIAPPWMLAKQDIKDGLTIGQYLQESPNYGLSINVSGENNSVVLQGLEQGKEIEENCRYRLKNWKDLKPKTFKNVAFSYKVIDTDEEKLDYGEIEGLGMRLPLKWTDGTKSRILEEHYKAEGKKSLLIDALVYYDTKTEEPNYLLITSFNDIN